MTIGVGSSGAQSSAWANEFPTLHLREHMMDMHGRGNHETLDVFAELMCHTRLCKEMGRGELVDSNAGM